jgi:hypothetical protein
MCRSLNSNAGTVIPNNLSTSNDIIDTDNVIKKRTLPVLYAVFWSNTGKVHLRVW